MEYKEASGLRVLHYTEMAKKEFSAKPNNFVDFVNDPEAIFIGDSLLAEEVSIGYNYIRKNSYPLPEEPRTILYSVYSSRYSHFGEVLARMETLNILDDNFDFYLRGTKIVGDYKDPELVERTLLLGSGKKAKTLESVEGTLAFRPKDEFQAIEMAAFLMREAPKIEGGYVDPDVRASIDLSELIGGIGFRRAVANVLTLRNGDLITLKQESSINLEKWRNSGVSINERLYKYLISGNVRP